MLEPPLFTEGMTANTLLSQVYTFCVGEEVLCSSDINTRSLSLLRAPDNTCMQYF